MKLETALKVLRSVQYSPKITNICAHASCNYQTTNALIKTFKNSNLVTEDESNNIFLTEKGFNAISIYEQVEDFITEGDPFA